jgi:hypothetical protein
MSHWKLYWRALRNPGAFVHWTVLWPYITLLLCIITFAPVTARLLVVVELSLLLMFYLSVMCAAATQAIARAEAQVTTVEVQCPPKTSEDSSGTP